ncbi:LAFE_0D09956g1_1 [Lachancea fermentati]|uniref:LAFE_0D09956g1_1 n=1 Tax=Lachancea fermentati TaxID=4955 RepID=A0A1G4MC19_LACFM|nr:LAFE_0D09956g1_1 [Lachancea fermentati]
MASSKAGGKNGGHTAARSPGKAGSRAREPAPGPVFKVINHDITTDVIEPLAPADAGRDAGRHAGIASVASDARHDHDDDGDGELAFPSHPKRFRGHAVAAAETAAAATHACDALEEIEKLVGRDGVLGTTADFWREVASACEDVDGDGDEDVTSDGASSDLAPAAMTPATSPLASPLAGDEPRLEDFISDAGTTSAPAAAAAAFQPRFQIKELCFRDADGKLALTAAGPAHVHKPAHLRASKSSKRLIKRALRRKSGVWEMVCPSVAVAEFMLL